MSHAMKSTIVRKALSQLRGDGLPRGLYRLSFRAINTVAVLKILRGLCVDRPDPKFLQCPDRLTPMLLTEPRLREFARYPENELSDEFVDQALARGDECFAICDGDRLAAYGWYAFAPTPIGLRDMFVCFSPTYVYMYKGFTHEQYRGQRLHAIGMTMALRHYLAQGYRGLVSYVESTNFESLKSCDRMGYFQFGSVYLVGYTGRCLAFSSPGCRPFDFRVERIAGSGEAGLALGKS